MLLYEQVRAYPSLRGRIPGADPSLFHLRNGGGKREQRVRLSLNMYERELQRRCNVAREPKVTRHRQIIYRNVATKRYTYTYIQWVNITIHDIRNEIWASLRWPCCVIVVGSDINNEREPNTAEIGAFSGVLTGRAAPVGVHPVSDIFDTICVVHFKCTQIFAVCFATNLGGFSRSTISLFPRRFILL